MINLGLKLGSKDTQYTEEILQYYEQGIFQYIELFVLSETYDDAISYWKQFNIPFGVHAPHSAAGLNLANESNRKNNVLKIAEAIRFADSLDAKYIIFHSGVNGVPSEVVKQLKPFADERILIENKPVLGIDGFTKCVGCSCDELKMIIEGIGNGCGFCLDFGHAICAARTLKKDPMEFIKQLQKLKPRVYHLTDGDYLSELDSHLHYGAGTFPLKDLLELVPDNAMITNEAKRFDFKSLMEFYKDSNYLSNLMDKN